VRVGVRLLGLGNDRLEARIAELGARLDNRGVALRREPDGNRREVSDGERVLGVAAGDLRDAER
jgi:hypothetical protein